MHEMDPEATQKNKHFQKLTLSGYLLSGQAN